MRRFLFLVVLMMFLDACAPAAAPAVQGAVTASVTVTPRPVAPLTPTAGVQAIPTLRPEDQPPTGALDEFITDFSVHSIPYNKVVYGGPGKDGIPVIDAPQYVAVAEAGEWIEPQEPVLLLRVQDDARVYPLQILVWHEIVNDTIGGLPLTITYCPLCNSGIAFDRRLEGVILDFGTTGRLYNSNLLMYDRLTESWWQQVTGEAVIGSYTGTRLKFHPIEMITWQDVRDAFPDALVLSRDTGEYRRYDLTPYHLYDDPAKRPFLYYGPETSGILPAMTRVLAVDLGGDPVAYPYPILGQTRVVNDLVGGQEIVIFWMSGAVSVLDKYRIANSRDVGSAVGYSRRLADRGLNFRYVNGRIYDSQTGTEWDILGRAIAGPLAGSQLEQIVATNHFWFSWYAFRPQTRIYPP